eukprot:CAMPEP_0202486532 /NCGR_PEP_ID=MMETSP1361-20130828/5083_1 /ASSEMBLY_ACC=CAM_ASM_000849 /TAXON_ID=210615 /ORGANISM="Staurosira complex sp., Strain CCMP2646" /LENGTH=417 /DNA_ID=CAMNT_0049115711 /DNA_START=34 /DNA_END=1287 /DNA_ORIENTATION=+
MLCCLGTPWSNSNDLYEQETGDFPGNRRFQKTAGNALVAADSFNHQQQQQQHQTTGLRDNNDERSGDVVCVTIPPGVSPGQALLVTAPDGSGRTIMVTVPQGLSEGSTFMAEFPPSASSPPSSPSVTSGQHAQVEAAPIDYSQVTPLAPPPLSLSPAIPPPTLEQEPFAQAVPVGVGPHETTISPIPTSNRQQNATHLPRPASPMASSFGQPMLRVQVPPGTPAGSTLYVSIPGENRTTVPAVVPPNVSYFHVPYEPQQQSQSNRTTSPVTVAPHALQNQKLLLVQVPPGIRAGETIHVSIPDEPGRLVAATVPPNVTKFQVAYQPMTNGNRSAAGMTNARNASSFPQQQQSANSRNGDGGGMGSMLLPALGGAALGMMGMSMYDHSRHYSDNNYDDNYNGNNDIDFGGGDFGAGNF